MSLKRYDNRFLVAMRAEGHVPVVKEIVGPEVNADKGERPPDRIEAEFQFERSAVRELTVSSNHQPSSGATVDLEWIRDLRQDKRVALASYRTATDGTLRLASAPNQLIEVFAYARGCEPARAIWQPGIPLRLDLPARKGRLSLPGLRPGYLARVRRSDQPEAVHTVRGDYGKPPELAVAPGAYDVTMYGDTGQVLGYQRVAVGPNEARSVDMGVDERPTLILRYKEDGWTAAVSDSTPSGSAFGWAIYSTVGGQFSIRDVAAVLDRESPHESVFRLSRAGKFHVQLTRDGSEQSWWRELDAAPGATITVDVPKRGAALRGSMRTYDGGVGFSHHGWAGPRFQLISDDAEGWSVNVFIPARDGEHTFTMRGLPAGAYHLHQHLIGTPKTYKGSGGEERHYTSPLDAWGGIPVKLADGEATALKDFVDYEYRDVTVSVEDAKGGLLSGATLRVRDRMSEAWRQVAEGPTTLSNAAHPIPYPPAVRVKQGRATLPSIRAGRLHLLVELDDGRVFPLTADVDPAASLTLRLPTGGGLR